MLTQPFLPARPIHKMASDSETGNERTPLLTQPRLSQLQHQQDEEASSIVASTVTKEERRLADSTVGERLPYNDYTTIDWLHDLVIYGSYHMALDGLTYLLGQRFIPVPLHTITSRHTLHSNLLSGRLLRLDCRYCNWSLDRVCSFCRRHCRSHGVGLESRVLLWPCISESGCLLCVIGATGTGFYFYATVVPNRSKTRSRSMC